MIEVTATKLSILWSQIQTRMYLITCSKWPQRSACLAIQWVSTSAGSGRCSPFAQVRSARLATLLKCITSMFVLHLIIFPLSQDSTLVGACPGASLNTFEN